MSLNILVCIKAVVLEATDGRVVRLSEICALNPFDRPSLEMAFRLRDEHKGKVTALSMGPEAGSIALYEVMAMGSDRAILLSDPALAGSDTLATSTALGAAIKKLGPFDLILFGARTSDSDTGQVGPQTAMLLGLPMVTGVYSLDYQEPVLTVERRVDSFVEKYEVRLPAALSVHPSAVWPRDPSLYGIGTAFAKGVLEKMDMTGLGIPPENVGETGSPTRVISLKRTDRNRNCEMISGSLDDQVDELVRRLKVLGYIG